MYSIYFYFSCLLLLCCRLLLLLVVSFTPALTDGFHWSLSDQKISQVHWTLLSALYDLNNAVVWMISPIPPFYISFSTILLLFLLIIIIIIISSF